MNCAYVCAILASIVVLNVVTTSAAIDYADTIYDYHDSGLGRNYYTGKPLVGPYGGYNGCGPFQWPVSVPLSIVLGYGFLLA